MEAVASLSQGRTAAAQYGLFTYKSVPVILNHLVLEVIFSIQDISCEFDSTSSTKLQW